MTAILRRWDEGRRRWVFSAAFAGFIAFYERVEATGQWRAEIKDRTNGSTIHLFERDLFTPRVFAKLEDLHQHVIEWGRERELIAAGT